MTAEWLAGTSHDDDSVFFGVGENFIHVDGRFFLNLSIDDAVFFPVQSERVADFNSGKVLENGGGVANDEDFMLTGAENAGDLFRDGEFMVDKRDGGDRSGEANGRNF